MCRARRSAVPTENLPEPLTGAGVSNEKGDGRVATSFIDQMRQTCHYPGLVCRKSVVAGVELTKTVREEKKRSQIIWNFIAKTLRWQRLLAALRRGKPSSPCATKILFVVNERTVIYQESKENEEGINTFSASNDMVNDG